jgi:hypothetical protein
MRKIFFYLACIFLPMAYLSSTQETPFSLQQKFTQAQAGDFIVTAQEGNYSLLCIRSINADNLLLEEISIPEKLIDLKKIEWKKWVQDKAPGHTSWTLFEIDRKSGALIECFSYSKNGWLYLDESEQFFSKLLTLSLNSISEKERKKIGPQPAHGEIDQRSIWNPPLIIEGKKIDKPSFAVFKTKWPDDGSRLALCTVELYFSKDHPTFPFPFWLEVQSPHYAFKMRAVDSGKGLVSPMTGAMPHRSPQIMSNTQKSKSYWKLLVQTPRYFQKLHLFVLDLTSQSKATISVPFTKKNDSKNEEVTLEIATSDLNKILQNGHRYQWVIIPDGSMNIYVESEEIFCWESS